MTITIQKTITEYSVQVIIAALNEAPGIGLTIAEMKDVLGEIPIIVVDGRSNDRTIEIARNLGAKIVCQDGVGKGDAIAKALEYIDLTADYIILTDADYTYPAYHLHEMIEILEEHPEVGMVCGNRFNGYLNEKALNGILNIGNRLLALAHNVLNGVHLDDPLTGLRVIRTSALKGVLIKSKGFDIEVELNHAIERRGFTAREVPIYYRERLGEKKLKMSHGLTILKRILLEALFRD